ncbi:hypothetical protein LOC67_20560 [Stieleria sp. JC731]|uniref:hypothetical protein n=1 Tax=Pirellulaceae TaxID=2691357 RepID=UPI001E3FCECB|nr:hypothetical protein [Stieleria sp. JC731]MCC9602949.1 hypothetical protein [Stieleria sp. JC731]
MRLQTENYDALLESHLELEERIADTLETLNEAMASMIDGTGVHGPSTDGLDRVAPLIEQLKERSELSRQSREQLLDGLADEVVGEQKRKIGLRQLIRHASETKAAQLDERRKVVSDRIVEARHSLTATQAVIFYSMDFHRRYLMGVLQCGDDQQGYQADGQSMKLPTEKIFGRNC